MGHIKISEAKFLVLMDSSPTRDRYAAKLCANLGIDYQYGLHILSSMLSKSWVSTVPGHNKVYYSLTPEGPLISAKEALSKEVERNANKRRDDK